jgi:ATP-dependent Clp protease ATP-binding subunit ClpC
MFERYAPESRRAIYFAHQAALSAGATAINARHILTGLLVDPSARVNTVLQLSEKLADEASAARALQKQAESKDISLTNDGKRILAYAAEESNRLGDYWIDTSDLLLGILREKKCEAARLLGRADLKLEMVRSVVSENNASQVDFGPVPDSWQNHVERPNVWPRRLQRVFVWGLLFGVLLVLYLIARH